VRARRALGGAALGALLAGLGCRENVTAPGSCPTLCPSSRMVLVDTVLTDIVTSDSAYRGYVAPREAATMPLAALDSLHSVALVRFGVRDSIWYPTTNDTAVHAKAVPDSVVLSLGLGERDTAVKDLRLLVYRLPGAFDTALTYADAQPFLTASQLVDSIPVASVMSDSVSSAAITWRLRTHALDTIPATDSGVVALAFVVRASRPAGLAISTTGSSLGGPYVYWYVHAQAPRDTLTHQFSVGAQFNTSVFDPPPAAPINALAAGGLPTARSILRLRLQPGVLDSARLVRATLILTQTAPARGLPQETFRVAARGLVRDLGPKSVIFSDTAAGGTVPVVAGDTGEIHIEIGRLLRAWGTAGGDSLPRVVMLLGEPEGGGLGEVTVARRTAGAAAPRLRVTYIRPYVFGVP
jgi:hypothetical protein